MKENIDEIVNDLIVGFLTDNNSPEENRSLYEWLKSSEGNKKLFQRIQKAWNSTSHTVPANDEIMASDLKKVYARLKILPQKNKPVYIKLSFLRIVATIVLFLGLSFLGIHFFGPKKNNGLSETLCRIVVPKGAKTMAQLPDGSSVWLNAGSTLTYYSQDFGVKSRYVKLEGEGFFSVVTNPKKPFIVETKKVKVKAYGTEFNVRSYPEEVTVETTLIHGIVKVEGENANNKHYEIQVKPKQTLICYAEIDSICPDIIETSPGSENTADDQTDNYKRPVLHDNVKTVLYTSWKDDRWVIEGERIGDLAVDLERRFNVDINFESEEIKNYMFTGTFCNETLEQVMQVIRLTAPIHYKIGKGEVVITSDERLKLKYEKYIN